MGAVCCEESSASMRPEVPAEGRVSKQFGPSGQKIKIEYFEKAHGRADAII